jgi:TonB family protein
MAGFEVITYGRFWVIAEGKVASVRVISGSPLLRDAALDAVQRWRYRPYLSSGGPIPMAAIAIMDFQLP